MLDLNAKKIIFLYGFSTLLLIISLIPVFRFYTKNLKILSNEYKQMLEPDEREFAILFPSALKNFIAAAIVNFTYNAGAFLLFFLSVHYNVIIPILSAFSIFAAIFIFYSFSSIYILTNKRIYIIKPCLFSRKFKYSDKYISYDEIKQISHVGFLKLIILKFKGNKRNINIFSLAETEIALKIINEQMGE